MAKFGYNINNKNRDTFNKICELLISMNLKDAEVAIHEYLTELNMLRFERFIGNLIILCIKEQDFTFTRAIYNLSLLGSNAFFDVESYKNNFYETLLTNTEQAKLYLEIILCLGENQEADIDKEKLEQAYIRAINLKK